MPRNPVFLPIELFKYRTVTATNSYELTFLSSGTTMDQRSKHHVADPDWYQKESIVNFESQYGALEQWTILALLPNYLEAGNSSLVFMVESFMKHAGEDSAFLMSDFDQAFEKLKTLTYEGRKTLLIGVSYALLDFAEQYPFHAPNLIVMETGGMKGRKVELTRKALHQAIKRSIHETQIHSEYGMTELLSQAYAQNGEWFKPPKWMKAYITDVSDPFTILPVGRRGLLAFIDLANKDSCSFIQTRDIGLVNQDGHFKVEGRLHNSDLRGCNLLYV